MVVPTLGARPQRLHALIEALAAAPAGPAEVIVVGPEDVPGARTVRRRPGLGAAAARNLGWRAATAPFVVFVDDDCLPAPGWLAALAAVATEDRFVQGRVAPHPDELHLLGPFARTLSVDAAGPFFQTANIMYPRVLLERLGGFDESYTGVGGEDTDLGWRALEMGADALFAPDALVWHAVEPLGALGLARHAARWAPAVATVKRHPGLRTHLYRRWFWKRSHAALLAALAGALLAPATLGASLLLALPWVVVHRGEHPSRASLATSLPGHLLVDAAEVAAMIRGSLAARTLLL